MLYGLSCEYVSGSENQALQMCVSKWDNFRMINWGLWLQQLTYFGRGSQKYVGINGKDFLCKGGRFFAQNGGGPPALGKMGVAPIWVQRNL